MRNLILTISALVLAACSAGGGGRPVYTPLGDMAMEISTPDLSMKQQGQPDLTMNDVPPDLSMVKQPPDLSMTAFIYGCNGLINCENNCTDQACIKMCQMEASPASNNIFQKLITCLFVQACPSSNSGVCDSTSANYVQANCDACLMKAQAQGGACYTPLQNCIADKP